MGWVGGCVCVGGGGAYLNESFLVWEHLFLLYLYLLDWGSRLHAFGLSCLLACLTPGSIESPGRHIHSYPVQMGPSSRHRRNCVVSARGDLVLVSPDFTPGGRKPGIGLVQLFAIVIFLHDLFSHS